MKPRCRTLVLHGALWPLALAAAAARADNDSPPSLEVTATAPVFRQFNKVEITGSSIIRAQETQALPVQLITREDIRRGGFTSTAELVQALPLMSNYVVGGQMFMANGGYSSAAIHGLPNGTLVLVNGLRMAPYGRVSMTGPERSGVDLQAVPLSDIERIEVLSDGASSLYGSDATAGVINILLRQERKGVELRAEHFWPQAGGGRGRMASLSWGQGQLEREGYRLVATAEVSTREELLGADRPGLAAGRYTFTHADQRYQADGALLGPAGAGLSLEQLHPGQPSVWAQPAAQGGRCATGTLPMAGQGVCLYNPYPRLGLSPREAQQRLHLNAERALGPGLVVFGQLLLAQSQSSLAYKPWSAARSAVGLLPGSEAEGLALAAGLDPAQTRLHWQPDLASLRLASVQSHARWSLGLRGEHAGWDHQGVLYVARSRAEHRPENPFAVRYDTLGLGQDAPWNRSDILLPASTIGLGRQVEGLRTPVPESRGTNTVSGLTVRGSRALFERHGQDVLLGLGAEWRQEQTDYQNLLGGRNGLGEPDFRAHRHVLAAHGELQLPLSPTLELLAGVRTDHYEDVGHTRNGKLATRWQWHPQWTLRGSLGTGFRAPGLAQLHRVDSPFLWATTEGPRTCTPALQALAQSLRTASGDSGQCVAGGLMPVLGQGNPQLRPENSTQMTWGLAFAPDGNLRLAADLWGVRIRDAILSPGAQAILASPLQNAAHLTLMPAALAQAGKLDPRQLALLVPLQNLGTQEKAGIDLEAQWRRPSVLGLWQLQGRATWLLRSRTQLAPGQPFESDLGQFNPALDQVSPRWRASVSGGLARPGWRLQLVLHHTSGYRDMAIEALQLASGQTETVRREVRSYTQWDVLMQADLRPGLQGRLGVRNLFNRSAPLSFASSSTQLFGANAVYAPLWGRVLELGLIARF